MRRIEHREYPEEELELSLERKGGAPPDPFLVLQGHTLEVEGRLLTGWACWEAPRVRGEGSCWEAFSRWEEGVVRCPRCGREYGVFTNSTAPGGRLLLTRR